METKTNKTEQGGQEGSALQNRSLKTFEEAEELFLTAEKRLFNVPGWNDLTGAEPGYYILLNSNGKTKTGNAEEGDFICLGADASRSSVDCLHVDRIITKLHNNDRSAALVVTPVKIKTNAGEVQQTLGNHSSYTFLIRLSGNEVTAGIYEKDSDGKNDDDLSLTDKISDFFKNAFGVHSDEEKHRLVLISRFLQ